MKERIYVIIDCQISNRLNNSFYMVNICYAEKCMCFNLLTNIKSFI